MMSDDRDDLEFLRRVRGLSGEVEPERDLWPEIRAALDEPGPRAKRWRLPSALAASLLLGAVAASLLFHAGTAPEPAGVPSARPALLEVGLAPELMRSRAQLIASLDAELARMSPESQAAVAESLKEIEASLAKIHDELEHNPDSRLLLDLLVSTYLRQIAVLGEMDGLARSVARSAQIERTET
jgi:hypothetical protein